MKKNIFLYVLLVFLIVVNAFFLFNYIGNTNAKNHEIPDRNRDFIVKELGFDDAQLEQFRVNSKNHHKNMMRLSDSIKILKDKFFDKLSDDLVDASEIDSITSLICIREKEKDEEVFYHFKMIQELCNDKQKEKFKRIIKDALRKGDRRAPPRGSEGKRPPPRNN